MKTYCLHVICSMLATVPLWPRAGDSNVRALSNLAVNKPPPEFHRLMSYWSVKWLSGESVSAKMDTPLSRSQPRTLWNMTSINSGGVNPNFSGHYVRPTPPAKAFRSVCAPWRLPDFQLDPHSRSAKILCTFGQSSAQWNGSAARNSSCNPPLSSESLSLNCS